jgi:NAD(P)-dependent dehydrogenase (short-subunit alcohol dehydrogenase family)
MAPASSIIITGAAGSLGAAIAEQLTSLFPNEYHLILAARNTSNENATSLSEQLEAAGAVFSWEELDLTSFSSVLGFAKRIGAAIEEQKLPELYGLINSAAISLATPTKSADGFDTIYQTNTLSPVLLMRELLSLFRNAKHGSVILNVSSATEAMGDIHYFQKESDNSLGKSLGLKEGLKKYGSSKLLLLMAGYAMQREADNVSLFSNATDKSTWLLSQESERLHIQSNIKIISTDPGGMNGNSRLSPTASPLLNVAVTVLTFLRPLVKLIDPSAINPPEVPANCIAQCVHNPSAESAGSHYVLNRLSKGSAISRDEAKQEKVLKMILNDLNNSET